MTRVSVVRREEVKLGAPIDGTREPYPRDACSAFRRHDSMPTEVVPSLMPRSRE